MTALPLPAHFRSLYRLLLRATSASVLHVRPASRRFQQLYRHTFDEAANVIHRLQSIGVEKTKERVHLEAFLKEFERRMDNTLVFLHNSATSRGLPHTVTKNLARLPKRRHSWLAGNRRHGAFSGQWNPQLPPHSEQYKPSAAIKKREAKEEQRMLHLEDIDRRVWAAFHETVRQAEARSGLVLGRMDPGKTTADLSNNMAKLPCE